MKKLLFFFLFFLTSVVIAPGVVAQKTFSFEYVTMGQGQSPVADGLYFTAAASHGDNLLTAAFTPVSAEAMYLNSDMFGVKDLYLGPSGGFMLGVPWVGPIVIYSPVSLLSLTAWTGISTGDAAIGDFNLKSPEVAFLQLDAKVNLGEKLHVGFSYLEFSGKNYLPYIGGEITLGGSMTLFGSATFPVENQEVQDPMFFLGFKLGLN